MRTMRVVFEVFSAIFVCTGLLVAIYSGHQGVRAVGGIGLIVLVSALTASLVLRLERRKETSDD